MLHAMLMSALVAVGQPPPPKPSPPAEAKPKPPSPLEQAVTRALQTHPDIRVAEAEVQMAQAKLAQAKLKITQQVTALHADIDRLKGAVQTATELFVNAEQMMKAGQGPRTEFLAAQSALVAAHANRAKAEAEYNALVGPTPPPTATARVVNEVYWTGNRVALSADGNFLAYTDADGTTRVVPSNDRTWASTLRIDTTPPPAPGSPADRLKAALDKPVKLAFQNRPYIKDVLDAVMKGAGVDIRIRAPGREDPAIWKDAIQMASLPAGEFPVGTWFEMVLDEVALRGTEAGANDRPERYELYVREYGLLMTSPKTAPPGAITVADLWKQTRAEKAKDKTEKK